MEIVEMVELVEVMTLAEGTGEVEMEMAEVEGMEEVVEMVEVGVEEMVEAGMEVEVGIDGIEIGMVGVGVEEVNIMEGMVKDGDGDVVEVGVE